MVNDQRVIILFVKYPEKGRVKTRLARSLGDDAAVKIYCQLVSRLVRMLREVSVRRCAFVMILQKSVSKSKLGCARSGWTRERCSLQRKFRTKSQRWFFGHNVKGILARACNWLSAKCLRKTRALEYPNHKFLRLAVIASK